jgi:hypothetical protein
MGHARAPNAEKSLSFCRLTKQRLINELADGIHERAGWHDDASPAHRPKFRVFTEKASTSTLARSIVMEQQPPTEGNQSGTPPTLEKLGNVWQVFTQGEDSPLSSSVRHLATFFVVEGTVVMLASGRTLHLSPELHEFVNQLMFNGVLNLHTLPEEILQDVCRRLSEGQK